MSISESSITLSGMTWNHTRGLLPMIATAQRFHELQPMVEIEWEKRSLQQFADAPLTELAARFDLLVIDHPSMGEAVHHDLLIPLDEHLAGEFLAGQAESSVGGSHASYQLDGHQYALAIDAATPVAGWRPDLLERFGVDIPTTWDDLLALARRGMVTVPAIPIDALMNVFMLAHSLGSEPFSIPGQVIPSREAGAETLRLLRELVQLSAPGALERNPIRTWQLLASSDTVAYCPFAYGYSNYSREGYAANVIHAGGLVSIQGQPLRSTLGGAGLAVSKRCRHVKEAMAYAQDVASALTQRTLYAFSGGQPGHRAAWTDDAVNRHTNDFFRNTLRTLDEAWVRPRFAGFIAFQEAASNVVHDYLVHGGSEGAVLDRMDNALHQYQATGATA